MNTLDAQLRAQTRLVRLLHGAAAAAAVLSALILIIALVPAESGIGTWRRC